MVKRFIVESLGFSLACAAICLSVLLSAQSFDGGAYLVRGSDRYYVMPLIETFAFLSTLIALCWFNKWRAFAASAIWLCTFALALLGGVYLKSAQTGSADGLMRWALFCCVDVASGALFAGAIGVYPALRKRFRKVP